MKFRRTLSASVISFFLCILVLFGMSLFKIIPEGLDAFSRMITDVIPSSDTGYTVSIGSMDSTLMRSVVLRNVSVSSGSEDVAGIEEVSVSVNLIDILKVAVGKYPEKVKVRIEGMYASVDDEMIASLGLAGEETDGDKGTFAIPDPEGMSLSIEMHDCSFYADIAGYTARIENLELRAGFDDGIVNAGIIDCDAEVCSQDFHVDVPKMSASAEASVSDGFSIMAVNLSVPEISFEYHSMEQAFELNSLRVSVNSDMECSVSIGCISSELMTLTELSCAATVSDEAVDGALFIENGMVKYSPYEGNFDSLLCRVIYDLKSHDLSVSLNASSLNALDSDGNACISGLRAEGFAEAGKYKASAYIDSCNGEYMGYEVSGEGVGASFGMNGESDLYGAADISHISCSCPEGFVFDDVSGNDVSLSVSSAEDGHKAFLYGLFRGKSKNSLIGDFSLTTAINASGNDEVLVSNADVSVYVDEIRCAEDFVKLDLSYAKDDEIKVNASVGEGLNLDLSYSFDEYLVSTAMYMSSFRPCVFAVLADELLTDDYFDEGTSIDGNLFVTGILNSDSVSDIISLKNTESPDFSDILTEGRISLNFVADDFLVGKKSSDGAVTLELQLEDDNISVDSLAVTVNGLRLSYQGKIDLVQLLPEGVLMVQNSSDGKEMGTLDFRYDEQTSSYGFTLSSSAVKDSVLSGTVSRQDEDRIYTQAVFDSGFLRDRTLPFSLTVLRNPLEFVLDGNHIAADVSFDDSLINADLDIENLGIDVSDKVSVDADASFDCRFNMLDGNFDVSVSELFVKVSDYLNLGFDMEITDHSLSMSELFIGRAEDTYQIDGKMEFTFDSIPDIFSGDTSSLSGTIDFRNETLGNYTRGSYTEDSFYFETSSDVLFISDFRFLGKRGSDCYGSGYIGSVANEDFGFYFNAKYSKGLFELYDSSGWFKSLTLDSISLSADILDPEIDGSFDFSNTINGTAGSSVQKGTVILDAKSDALTSGVLSLAGLSSRLEFNLGLRNVNLEGYEVKDTDISVSLENKRLEVKGDDINGTVDFNGKYVDMSIDSSMLLGLRVKGYYGEELDLMVNDLVFPMPVLNQFLNIPVMDFLEGDITGDFMIKGPMKAPELYGMLYCRTFEMDLFYLPGQVIDVNNLAIALQGHSFTSSRTPLVGFSNLDGRFFRGDVSLEANLQGLGFESLFVNVSIDEDTPIDFWLPLLLGGETEMNIRSDVTGDVKLQVSNGLNLITDAVVSDACVDFTLDPVPEWFGKESNPIGLDLTITTGKDVEFCYPDKDSALLKFISDEDKTVHLVVDSVTGAVSTDGSISFKTGQIFYFQNDFYITEGSLDVSPKKYSFGSSIPLSLDLVAKLKDYDASGNKVEISLILQDASLDNLSPRFESTPGMSENEIIQLLGKTILPSNSFDGQISAASIASLAVTATNAITKLGLLESDGNYTLSGTLRDALGLDIFSARSAILSNIIIDALPGQLTSSEISLISRYLDGTSFFAGKYIGQSFFARLSLMLRSDKDFNSEKDIGHFLSRDLILDVEVSLDWDNPLGTFSVFSQPRELSVLSILDTIGFSVTKKIKF